VQPARQIGAKLEEVSVKALIAAVVLLTVTMPGSAQPLVERNVVYGMYSGLALLMDVYKPSKPNGFAILAIQGSGWYSPMRYDAPQLKSHREVTAHAEGFAAHGYTVFVVNHRQAPRFRYPAPIEDAQRAVRFVRSRASEYGISADRIGAWGSSSGGHLVELLGTMDGHGDPAASDPVNRLSAKVQAVVALFAPSDLPSHFGTASRPGTIASLMGFAYQDPSLGPAGMVRPDDVEIKQYRDASPLAHVSSDDAPMLLFHGDEDVIVPITQSEIIETALKQAGVKVRLIKVPGGRHGPSFQLPAGDPRLPDHRGEAVRWFDAQLKPRHPVAPKPHDAAEPCDR
jgi:acetyl esterase/lipase